MSWPMVKLGDILSIIRGVTFKPNDQVEPLSEGSTIVMRTKNVQRSGLDISDLIAIPDSFIKRDEQYLRSEDMLISSANSWELVGKISFIDKLPAKSTAGGFISIIRAKKEKVIPKYLYYWLTLEHTQVKIRNCGQKTTNISNLNLERFKELFIPLPSLNDQRRIVAILDKAANIRQKREQAIKLSDDFLRATFLEMFGDPVENPKGWKVKPLISVIVGELQNGAYFPKDKYSKEGVEMVHMADAFYDVIQQGSLKRVQASDADIVKYSLTHEDLMISRRSLNYEGAAKPSLIPQSDEPLIFESSMIRITPDKKQIDKLFLFYYLTDPLVKEHFIRKFVTGATIKGINQKNLEQVRIIVPPLELQKKFSYIVHTLEKHKKKINESEILSIELFTAISQRAFLDQL
ncbi:restriction endonuclease subunit S [Escherichia coli]|uniref:restriction endonuclease subunit S n=2 Tax=Escherichia coli TaxID=562 RepID=UPI001C73EDF5|nr:restriction endonuclease subunit S [Escherichia coli]MBW8386731.1 restriction endonuclease subunit S [Escherichia coli]MBW8391380.1 restriction endonuclease subunit S [Escherichia coli]MBW8395968.1 restriction endonuclease subunit S [Escherichia coli]MBW8401074.1 restriction endonuclease subunit S [Escherichia coli]MBW8438088.1 restriction endonuclease subunit S [Escherichia coli]